VSGGPLIDDAVRLRTLAMTRISYVLGVLLFGGVTFWLQRQGRLPPPAASETTFRTIGYLIWPLGLAAILAIRSRVGRQPVLAKRAPWLTLGWAIGEGVALFGAVRYFAFGDPRSFVEGLLFLVLALILLPLRAP